MYEKRYILILFDDVRTRLAEGLTATHDFLAPAQHTLYHYRALRSRLDALTWNTDFLTARTIARGRLALYRRLSTLIGRIKLMHATEHSIFHKRRVCKLRLRVPTSLAYGDQVLQPRDWRRYSLLHYQSVYRSVIDLDGDATLRPVKILEKKFEKRS